MRWLACILIGATATGAAFADDPDTAGNTDWPAYNRTLTGDRYSTLDLITRENIKDLKPVCTLDVGDPGPFQTSPVLVDGTVYITTGYTTVAVDPVTCQAKWRNIYTPEEKVVYVANRGVAVMDGVVYRGTGDGRIVAIDATTGDTRWTKKVVDPTVGEFISSAPVAHDGMIYVGPSGSDWGIRGRVLGLDAATGDEKWRFWTIPMGDEPGAETWHLPETAKRGGGGMWTTYTLDPETNELFVPVANPSPDFAPQYRPGDNLYTNSVVVLDAATGALKWYYQFTPADGFDYDLGAAPILYADGTSGRKRLAAASKDGNLYAIDRESQALVFKTPVTTIVPPAYPATQAPVYACPGPLGGVEWNGPAYDPQTNTLFTGAVDWCSVFETSQEQPDYDPGHTYYGTNAHPPKGQPANGWVTAVDASTGGIRWRFKTPHPVVSGVTPTAGGLLLVGDLGGNFYAFDKKTGEILLTLDLGGSIAGGVITYMIDGKQYVATTAGNISRATFGALGDPTFVVMGTDAPTEPTKVTLARQGGGGAIGSPDPDDDDAPASTTASATAPAPTATAASAAATAAPDVSAGQRTYASYCAGCHGANGEGAVGPALLDEEKRKNMAATIDWIEHPNAPMPSLYPSVLNEQDVRNVAAYVLQTFRSSN